MRDCTEQTLNVLRNTYEALQEQGRAPIYQSAKFFVGKVQEWNRQFGTVSLACPHGFDFAEYTRQYREGGRIPVATSFAQHVGEYFEKQNARLKIHSHHVLALIGIGEQIIGLQAMRSPGPILRTLFRNQVEAMDHQKQTFIDTHLASAHKHWSAILGYRHDHKATLEDVVSFAHNKHRICAEINGTSVQWAQMPAARLRNA